MSADDPAPGTARVKSVPVKLNPVRVAIPTEDPRTRTKDFREVLHPYGLEDAVLEAQRCIQCGKPYCVEACPITQDARKYIGLVAERKFDEAARAILTEDPLATTLCKVCYHYCEDACIVSKKGIPVAIRQLKRAGLELGNSKLLYVPSAPKHQRVAVVGAGPAGIMAAWELGLRGYDVTVFEELEHAGGQITTIPRYRMTGGELAEDLARFRDLPVHFETRREIGKSISVDSLMKDGYQAVFLALGTTRHRSLQIPGEELPGVVPAFEWLRAVNDAHAPSKEPMGRVVVIGGGDVAMDAVRSAARLSPGVPITLVYRRGRSEMLADKEEVREAEQEGVAFLFQTHPVRIVGTQRVEGLEVQRVELGPVDHSGRRSPVPVEGTNSILPCDTVIVAVGQQANVASFPTELHLGFGSQGWPQGGREGFETDREGVFAAGGKSVVYAMAAGTRAAEAIDRYLARQRGGEPTPRPDPWGSAIPPPPVPRGYGKPTWKL